MDIDVKFETPNNITVTVTHGTTGFDSSPASLTVPVVVVVLILVGFCCACFLGLKFGGKEKSKLASSSPVRNIRNLISNGSRAYRRQRTGFVESAESTSVPESGGRRRSQQGTGRRQSVNQSSGSGRRQSVNQASGSVGVGRGVAAGGRALAGGSGRGSKLNSNGSPVFSFTLTKEPSETYERRVQLPIPLPSDVSSQLNDPAALPRPPRSPNPNGGSRSSSRRRSSRQGRLGSLDDLPRNRSKQNRSSSFHYRGSGRMAVEETAPFVQTPNPLRGLQPPFLAPVVSSEYWNLPLMFGPPVTGADNSASDSDWQSDWEVSYDEELSANEEDAKRQTVAARLVASRSHGPAGELASLANSVAEIASTRTPALNRLLRERTLRRARNVSQDEQRRHSGGGLYGRRGQQNDQQRRRSSGCSSPHDQRGRLSDLPRRLSGDRPLQEQKYQEKLRQLYDAQLQLKRTTNEDVKPVGKLAAKPVGRPAENPAAKPDENPAAKPTAKASEKKPAAQQSIRTKSRQKKRVKRDSRSIGRRPVPHLQHKSKEEIIEHHQ